MMAQPKAMVLPLVVIVTCLIPLRWGVQHCPTGHFWNRDKHDCQKCSSCPPDNIIRDPCSHETDTLCTPFFEFHQFNQISGENGPIDYVPLNVPGSEPDFVTAGDPVVEIEEMPTITKDEGEYWKNLAFALIGVLCALIVVATVIVLLACRKLHETASSKQPEDDDGDDTDSGYVVIRQIRQLAGEATASTSDVGREQSMNTQTSRHQRVPWAYRPKRRLLSECVDDVFESEDSAGSRSSRKIPLTAIPERSDSEGNAETV